MSSRGLTMDERLSFLPPPKVPKACLLCERVFTPRTRQHIFCSKACQESEYIARQRMRNAEVRRRILDTGALDRPCRQCQQICRPADEYVRADAPVYCSADCKRAADAQRYRNAIARAERRKAGALSCKWCEVAFKPKDKGRIPDFCSEACRLRHNSHQKTEARRTARRAMGIPLKLDREQGQYIEDDDRAPILESERTCENCARWSAKGCALEAFTICKPGVLAKFWEERC